MSAPRKMTLVPLIAAIYFLVAGGPFGLEDIVYSGFAAGRATRQPFTFMLVALFVYLTLTILSDVGLRVLERRYARGVVRGIGT